jgi:phospholipid/cholesterol/gamma-HCH transport system substrate-binding protein
MNGRESRVQMRVGVFVLAAITLFVVFVLTIGSQTRIFEARYPLKASFSAVGGLLVGAPVRLGGFTVGGVTRIGFGRDPQDKRIVVDLSIDRNYRDRIREDSVATINTIGLVGDKYVEITVGSPDRKVLDPLAEIKSLDPADFGKLLESVSKLGVTMEEFFAGAGSKDTRENLAALIKSLRSTLDRVEKGPGMVHALVYDPKGVEVVGQISRVTAALTQAGDTIGRVGVTAEGVMGEAQAILREVRQGKGLIHALVYGDAEETLGRLNRALASLDDVMREVRQGKGLLHAMIYDAEGGQGLARLSRAAQAVEELARAAKEGPGLLHALIADPKGASLVADLADAAADLKRITGKLARGEGTLGALLDDPTLYEDLSTLLRGAERSVILRTLIRSSMDRGQGAKETP